MSRNAKFVVIQVGVAAHEHHQSPLGLPLFDEGASG
jgi:hypothetical protein